MDGLRVAAGEYVTSTGRAGKQVRVTPRMVEVLPALRERLIDVARAGGTVTYAQAAEAASGSYLPRGMGPLLDVLAADCARRGEPRLDALVVTKSDGEVASGFDGNPPADRRACWTHWK